MRSNGSKAVKGIFHDRIPNHRIPAKFKLEIPRIAGVCHTVWSDGREHIQQRGGDARMIAEAVFRVRIAGETSFICWAGAGAFNFSSFGVEQFDRGASGDGERCVDDADPE